MDEKALKKSNSCESPKKMVTFERILSFFLSSSFSSLCTLSRFYSFTSILHPRKCLHRRIIRQSFFFSPFMQQASRVFKVARKLPNEIFTWLFGKFVKRLSIRGSRVFSKNNSSPRQATFHLRYC